MTAPTRVLPLVAALAPLAAPAAAQAQVPATIAPSAPCVVTGTPLAATLAGLPAGQTVRVGFRNDAGQVKALVGPDGAAAVPSVLAPRYLAQPEAHATEPFTLSAFPDQDGPTVAPLASAVVRVAQRNAFLLPRTADVDRVRTVDAAGFAPGARLYAHVRIKGIRTRTTSLGSAGSCGDVRVRRRLFPTRGLPQYAVAYVTVDASRRASTATRPQAEVQLRLRRRFVGVKPNYLTETSFRTFRP